MDAFGFATKAKPRLVARGDMQREFVDFANLDVVRFLERLLN